MMEGMLLLLDSCNIQQELMMGVDRYCTFARVGSASATIYKPQPEKRRWQGRSQLGNITCLLSLPPRAPNRKNALSPPPPTYIGTGTGAGTSASTSSRSTTSYCCSKNTRDSIFFGRSSDATIQNFVVVFFVLLLLRRHKQIPLVKIAAI